MCWVTAACPDVEQTHPPQLGSEAGFLLPRGFLRMGETRSFHFKFVISLSFIYEAQRGTLYFALFCSVSTVWIKMNPFSNLKSTFISIKISQLFYLSPARQDCCN